jgi:2-iminobutanoate/2-iminopropanoate deaminase
MSNIKVTTDKSPGAIGPYSQGIIANGFVFVSGQLPVEPSTGNIISDDVGDQTSQSIKNISNILQASGSSLEKLVKTTVYLKDMNDFAAMNEAYSKFFINNDNKPARACIEVSRLPKDINVKVEIDGIAIV